MSSPHQLYYAQNSENKVWVPKKLGAVEFDCTICTERRAPKGKVACLGCGNSVCVYCFSQMVSCPFCRKVYDEEIPLLRRPLVVSMLISKIGSFTRKVDKIAVCNHIYSVLLSRQFRCLFQSQAFLTTSYTKLLTLREEGWNRASHFLNLFEELHIN